jgi:hypothetical protein
MLRSMILKSITNPEAVSIFINQLLALYASVFWYVFVCSLLIAFFNLWYDVFRGKENIKPKENSFNDRLLRWLKSAREILRKILKFPVIWRFLTMIPRMLVSLLFWLIESVKENGLEFVNQDPKEQFLLWLWSLYSILFFAIAPFFIWFSFGNKFVRNIWILVYILWIAFVLLGQFLELWDVAYNGPILLN